MAILILQLKKLNRKIIKLEIIIRKVGTIPTPIKLKIIYENETEDEYYYSAEVWKENKNIFKIEIELSEILKEIKLGGSLIPDSNRENNIYVVH